ncbi:hypothetical protein [Yoonia sp. MH D7]
MPFDIMKVMGEVEFCFRSLERGQNRFGKAAGAFSIAILWKPPKAKIPLWRRSRTATIRVSSRQARTKRTLPGSRNMGRFMSQPSISSASSFPTESHRRLSGLCSWQNGPLKTVIGAVGDQVAPMMETRFQFVVVDDCDITPQIKHGADEVEDSSFRAAIFMKFQKNETPPPEVPMLSGPSRNRASTGFASGDPSQH